MVKQFIKDSSIYTFSTILGRGINVLLLPIYTRFLSPNEYGIIEILAITFTLLNLILPLEVSQALARFIPDPKNKSYKSDYASTAFWLTVFVFGITLLLIFISPNSFAKLLFSGKANITVIKLAGIAMLLTALKNLLTNLLRINLQSLASATISIVYGLLMAITSVILIAKYNYGVQGYIWGQIIASTFGFTLGLLFSKPNIAIAFKFDINRLKELLSFSTPLVLSSAAVYVNMFVDRWMLRYWLGLEEVGIYSVSYKVAALLGIILSPFQMALTPIIYRQFKEINSPIVINNIFRYFLMLVIPLIALLSIFANEVVRLLSGPDFYMASEQVALLSLSTALLFLYIFTPGLGIANKTKIIAIINILTAIVNVVLNYMLIPDFGRMGAAIATFSAALFSVILYFSTSNKFYKIPYNKIKYIAVFLLLLSVLFFNYSVNLSFTNRLLLLLFISFFSCLVLTDKKDLHKFLPILGN